MEMVTIWSGVQTPWQMALPMRRTTEVPRSTRFRARHGAELRVPLMVATRRPDADTALGSRNRVLHGGGGGRWLHRWHREVALHRAGPEGDSPLAWRCSRLRHY